VTLVGRLGNQRWIDSATTHFYYSLVTSQTLARPTQLDNATPKLFTRRHTSLCISHDTRLCSISIPGRKTENWGIWTLGIEVLSFSCALSITAVTAKTFADCDHIYVRSCLSIMTGLRLLRFPMDPRRSQRDAYCRGLHLFRSSSVLSFCAVLSETRSALFSCTSRFCQKHDLHSFLVPVGFVSDAICTLFLYETESSSVHLCIYIAK
jgi:hypothetical protein